jgi:ParB-like chromosome segregation protein Spo0J
MTCACGVSAELRMVAVSELRPGRRVRASLVRSVRRFGVMEPVTVAEVRGRLVVRDGRRRVAAAQAAGLDVIPARVVVAR